ncbi:MAG TPA: PAS domain-containing protein [Rhizomicrobium sp.]|nr:PAS domain-containing protein [Rhizomicrobium sp.]
MGRNPDKTANSSDGESERFRLVAETAPVMLWMGDADGKCVYLNRALREFWGVAELDGFDWSSTLHPEDGEKLYAPFSAAMRDRAAFTVEARYRRADGTWRTLSTEGQPRFGADGAFLGMIGVNVDTTDRNAAEASLRAAKENRDFIFALGERQRALQDPDAVMQTTAELVGRHMNADRAGFYRMAGDTTLVFGPNWCRGDMPSLAGRVIDTATLGDGYNDHARAGLSVVSNDTALPGDIGAQAGKLGARAGIASPMLRMGRWTSGFYVSSAVPRQWTADEIAFVEEISEMSWDNVERAQAEAALREAEARSRAELERLVDERTAALRASEARMRTIFDTSYQLMGLLALDGTLLDANPVALNAIECELGAVMGRKLWDTPWFTATPGMPEFVREAVGRVAAGDTMQEEVTVNLPTGVRTFNFAMRPVRDDDGAVVAIVPEATELTDQRLAEEQLRQSQKMEAVGQLTGGIAHDFNNMLAVIVGGLNLLQRRLQRGEANVQQYIDAALEGATRAADLVQRLLAFSRQQPLKPEPLDLNRLVADMRELLARTLGEHVRIETVGGAGLWKVHADLVQLENVVINLSVNARDAMPESGGKLTIETANTFIDEYYAREHHVPSGQYVMIAVTDTGHGMTPEVLARAFDPFFTTKGVGKGTGLGLSQVFGFVRQSGGHVKIYSEPGVGTSVKVYLPRYYGDAVTAEPKRAVAAHTAHDGETVLVVEDEERVRSFSVEALRELGYAVLEAASGAEALRLIESGAPIALLFSDVVMPEMTGRQLADRACELRPGLKVLFTTGYTRNAAVHNGVLEPGIDALAKPFTIDQLAAKVRAAIDG